MTSQKVKCPTCKKEFSYYDSKFRPFCEERCKMVDLGHWFDESYTVPAKPETMEEVMTLEQILQTQNEDEH